jgi:hypothetical protein
MKKYIYMCIYIIFEERLYTAGPTKDNHDYSNDLGSNQLK